MKTEALLVVCCLALAARAEGKDDKVAPDVPGGGAARAADIPPELKTPNYRFGELKGIGYEEGVDRQDPSNVLKVDGRYHVWYTRRKAGVHPYASTIYYATSEDARDWTEQGEALGKGEPDAWDSFGVITPYVAHVSGKFYLYYTGTHAPDGFRSRDPRGTLRHIGVAIADRPQGPWQRFADHPVLSPTAGQWDSLIVDDAHLIVRGNKCWLYYKGGHGTIRPDQTQWGLAVADKPTGPFVKSDANPLIGGHTVCLWPHRGGVAALIDSAGAERHTVQWSPDGIHFTRTAEVIGGVLTGGGPYEPDAFTGDGHGAGITWGVAQQSIRGRLCIVRFDCDLAAPEPPDRRPDRAIVCRAPARYTPCPGLPRRRPGEPGPSRKECSPWGRQRISPIRLC